MSKFNLNQHQESKDGKWVWRHGLIFKTGEYPDKQFSLSEKELKAAVNQFKPVPIDVEHLRQSPLDGKLGSLEHIMIGNDGKSLYGTVRVPKWFHENVYSNQPMKVSCSWSREQKRLSKLALTVSPRINDAVLMSQFSKNRLNSGEDEKKVLGDFFAWFADKYDYTKTNKGQGQMQELHDLAARFGSICSKSNKNEKSYSYFGSQEESDAIQKIHDLAVKAGAGCDFKRDYSAMYSDTGDKTMTLKEKFAKFFESLDKEEVEIDETPETKELEALRKKVEKLEAEKDAGFSKAPEDALFEDTETKDENPEVKKLRERVAALELEKLNVEASAFATNEVKRTTISPAIEKDVVRFYVQLADDDVSKSTEVTFTNNGKETKGSRVDAFKAIFSTLKPNNLTQEEIVDLGAGILNGSDFNQMDVEKEAVEQATKFAQLRNKKANA